MITWGNIDLLIEAVIMMTILVAYSFTIVWRDPVALIIYGLTGVIGALSTLLSLRWIFGGGLDVGWYVWLRTIVLTMLPIVSLGLGVMYGKLQRERRREERKGAGEEHDVRL